MDGWWDVEKLDEFFYKIFKADLDKKVSKSWQDIINAVMLKMFNYQTKKLSKVVGKQHYDLSNEFFKAMLDKRMIYTCGYWKNAKNLDEAQEHKLDLTCRKLGLKPGMTVLDIGCSEGYFSRELARKGYKVTAVDYRPGYIAVARYLSILEGLDIEYHCVDDWSSFIDNSKDGYDTILFLCVIHNDMKKIGIDFGINKLQFFRERAKRVLLDRSYSGSSHSRGYRGELTEHS